MVHFKCDLCGKDLVAIGDSRYVVRISAYPGCDPDQITDDDLDIDQMEELAEAIRRDEQCHEGEDRGYRGFRFDLCECCHKKFVRDPLGRELAKAADFSGFSKN